MVRLTADTRRCHSLEPASEGSHLPAGAIGFPLAESLRAGPGGEALVAGRRWVAASLRQESLEGPASSSK
jgi:hypothetical protein